MRKRLAMCLAVMLLLAACAPQEPPESSTSQAPSSTTEPTMPSTTEPPAEAEEDWYASELEYTLSYEDLTTKDLPYSGGQWMVTGETGVAAFRAWANGGSLGIIELGKGHDPIHTIPLPEEMQEVETLGCNGQRAYIATQTQIAAIDLKTGEISTVVAADNLLDSNMVSHDVIYYATESEGKATIYRLYIPDMKTDTIYQDITVYPASEFRVIPPTTTLGEIGWSMMNPQLLEILYREFANPDSIYKKSSDKDDFSGAWGQPGRIDTYQEVNHLARSILQVIQNDTGIQALVWCRFDPATGELTEKLGTIDTCFTGTELWHDHFTPDAPAPEIPQAEVSDWQSIPVSPLPQSQETLTQEKEGESNYRLFSYTAPYELPKFYVCQSDAPARLLAEDPQGISVGDYIVTESYFYYYSRDGKLIQCSWDGTIQNTLYEAQHGDLQQMAFYQGMLYTMDGDYLIQIDVPQLRWRTLAQAECVVRAYVLSGEEDAQELRFYICQSQGLHQQQFTLGLETFTIEEYPYYA